jgi:FkbM family methyltransferase
MKAIIIKVLSSLGIKLLKRNDYENLSRNLDHYRNLCYSIELISEIPISLRTSFQDIFIRNYKDAHSQILQDIFVLSVLSSKRNGFFVEAGASDGLDCSNTFLLEKNFDWDGILIEPSRESFKNIGLNRKSAAINLALFSSSKDSMEFRETVSPGLSGLTEFSGNGVMADLRIDKARYEVRTISLIDVLYLINAPKEIDYLSLDTEGSEFEILKDFDFNTYSFSVITVEHGYSREREKVYELLTSNNYRRVLTEFSAYDDWYINHKIELELRDKNIILD